MNLREEIETAFEGKAFLRPLFYQYPGGLRFELAEGDTVIGRLLSAVQKASKICSDIFPDGSGLVVCLCLRVGAEKTSFYSQIIRDLRLAGIKIPRSRCIWTESALSDDIFDEEAEEWVLYVAFEIPKSLLQNALWCSFVNDLGSVHPRPGCEVYLFNLQHRVMVWPYDDRGMDVVGANPELLSGLYLKYQENLLDYDRDAMAKTFEGIRVGN